MFQTILICISFIKKTLDIFYDHYHRGLPLITYASRGGGGVNTNVYKSVQGGGGSEHVQKYAFCMQVY